MEMKRLLTVFFTFVMVSACAMAEPTLQEFYNDLYDYSNSQEENLATRKDATARDFRAKIEQLRYEKYQLRKNSNMPDTQKVDRARQIDRELEYYEMRLDQCK